MEVRVGQWRKLSAKELMFLNCGVGEDSWESLGLQGDPTSPTILKETSPGCSLEELMLRLELQYFGHLMRRVDSLEKTLMLGGWGAGGEGDNRWWDCWMASLTQCTWVWGTLGVGDGQGGLACCHSWGRKESDTNELLNWTDVSIQILELFVLVLWKHILVFWQWSFEYLDCLWYYGHFNNINSSNPWAWYQSFYLFVLSSVSVISVIVFRVQVFTSLLRFMYVLVAQSCPTPCYPIDCSLPGFSVHWIPQARILKWLAIAFSGGSSQPRDQTLVSLLRFTPEYFILFDVIVNRIIFLVLFLVIINV